MRKFFIIFFILSGIVSATFISITTTVSTERIVRDNETPVNLTIVNSGDEPAYDVLVSLITSEGLDSNELFPGKLNPNEPYSGEFKIKIDENVTPGAYNIGVITDYKDANGYPFSAISTFSFIIKEPTFSRVTTKISEITLGDKETKDLKLSIRNFDDKPHSIQVELFLPRELRSDKEKKTLVIDKKSDEEISFSISSFGALPRSNYVIFATINYEEEGLHYSSSSSGIIHVVEQKGFDIPSWIPIAIVIPSWISIAAVLILILIFILYQFRK